MVKDQVRVVVVQHDNKVIEAFEDYKEAFKFAETKYGNDFTITGLPVKTKEA